MRFFVLVLLLIASVGAVPLTSILANLRASIEAKGAQECTAALDDIGRIMQRPSCAPALAMFEAGFPPSWGTGSESGDRAVALNYTRIYCVESECDADMTKAWDIVVNNCDVNNANTEEQLRLYGSVLPAVCTMIKNDYCLVDYSMFLALSMTVGEEGGWTYKQLTASCTPCVNQVFQHATARLGRSNLGPALIALAACDKVMGNYSILAFQNYMSFLPQSTATAPPRRTPPKFAMDAQAFTLSAFTTAAASSAGGSSDDFVLTTEMLTAMCDPATTRYAALVGEAGAIWEGTYESTLTEQFPVICQHNKDGFCALLLFNDTIRKAFNESCGDVDADSFDFETSPCVPACKTWMEHMVHEHGCCATATLGGMDFGGDSEEPMNFLAWCKVSSPPICNSDLNTVHAEISGINIDWFTTNNNNETLLEYVSTALALRAGGSVLNATVSLSNNIVVVETIVSPIVDNGKGLNHDLMKPFYLSGLNARLNLSKWSSFFTQPITVTGYVNQGSAALATPLFALVLFLACILFA